MKTAIEWVEIADRRGNQTQPSGTYKWIEDIQSDVIMDVARFIREQQRDTTKARKEALDVVMEKLDEMYMRK